VTTPASHRLRRTGSTWGARASVRCGLWHRRGGSSNLTKQSPVARGRRKSPLCHIGIPTLGPHRPQTIRDVARRILL